MAKVVLQSTDSPKNSRGDINNNFTELYTGQEIYQSTSKSTPVDGDSIGLIDSAASYVLKQLSFLNFKVAIGSYLNPIGTIKEFNISTNPGTLYGFGTWVAHGTGRSTIAIDAGQTEFDTLGETGGAKTHTLSTAELAAHGHTFSGTTGGSNTALTGSLSMHGSGSGSSLSSVSGQLVSTGTDTSYRSGTLTGGANSQYGFSFNLAHSHNYSGTTANAGSGSAHNNLHPYIVVYRWVRTA